VSVRSLADSLSASVVCVGEDGGKAMIERFCVGAMDVEHALRVFRGSRGRRSSPADTARNPAGGARDGHGVPGADRRVAPNELILARAREKGVALLTVAEDTMATVEPVRESSRPPADPGAGKGRGASTWCARPWTPRAAVAVPAPLLTSRRSLYYGMRGLGDRSPIHAENPYYPEDGERDGPLQELDSAWGSAR